MALLIYLITISIHAPLRERPHAILYFYISRHFNPRSLTGATNRDVRLARKNLNFNPRSLTGATSQNLAYVIVDYISIHAPLRERRSRCVL